MRMLALIGAALMAAALGATVALYRRDRPHPVIQATETVVTRTLPGGALRVPLPPGFCTLDANKPEESTILRHVAGMLRNPSHEAVVIALPCERRAWLDAPGLRRDLRIVALVAVRPPGGGRDVARMSRAAFITRLVDRTGGLEAEVFAAPGYGGRSGSVARAGQDENAFYLRLDGVPTGGGETACGVMAMTLAGGAMVTQLVMEHCDTAPVDDDILPQSRHLAARLAALNP